MKRLSKNDIRMEDYRHVEMCDDYKPLVFTSNDSTQVLTKVGGVELTVADVPSTGIYLFFYDKTGNVMQLLSITE